MVCQSSTLSHALGTEGIGPSALTPDLAIELGGDCQRHRRARSSFPILLGPPPVLNSAIGAIETQH